MKLIFAALLAIACLTTGSSTRGQGPDSDSDLAPESTSKILEKILLDWATRPPQQCSGELRWKFASRFRSSQFGSSSGYVNNPQNPPVSEVVRVRFDQECLRFDGLAEPAIQLGRPILPDSDSGILVVENRFRIALKNGFSKDDRGLLLPQLYTVVIDRQCETHFWRNKTEAGSYVVVFPVGTAGPLLFYDSTKAIGLPLLWGLVETMRLALSPTLLFDAHTVTDNGHVLSIRPQMDGRRCIAVDFPMIHLPGGFICRLVIDPSRGSVVVRATFRRESSAPITQYDIEYDQDEFGHWWPAELTLVQFNGFGDPYDELKAIRSDLKVTPETTSVEKLGKLLPGTWVIDQVAMNRRVINPDGTGRVVSFSEAIAKVSPSHQFDHIDAEQGLERIPRSGLLDPWVAGILIADALVVAGAGVYWWRTSRSPWKTK